MRQLAQQEFNALQEKEKHDKMLMALLNTNKASEKKIWMRKVCKTHKKKKLNPNMGYNKVDWKNVAIAKKRV